MPSGENTYRPIYAIPSDNTYELQPMMSIPAPRREGSLSISQLPRTPNTAKPDQSRNVPGRKARDLSDISESPSLENGSPCMSGAIQLDLARGRDQPRCSAVAKGKQPATSSPSQTENGAEARLQVTKEDANDRLSQGDHGISKLGKGNGASCSARFPSQENSGSGVRSTTSKSNGDRTTQERPPGSGETTTVQ